MKLPPLARDPYGRFRLWPVPEMVAFGQLVRRARRMTGMNQHQLAARSEVSQSTICRLELGLVPGMATWKLVKIGMGLKGTLPLGFCPHNHECEWPKYATERLGELRPTPANPREPSW
jgi:hypothetical protein